MEDGKPVEDPVLASGISDMFTKSGYSYVCRWEKTNFSHCTKRYKWYTIDKQPPSEYLLPALVPTKFKFNSYVGDRDRAVLCICIIRICFVLFCCVF